MKLHIHFILFFILTFVFSGFGQDTIPVKAENLFGDLRARHIGPALMSGRISDIEMHPINAKIVYIGAAGGGVWKSNNAGTTFNPIFDKHSQSIGAVELDPNDPDNTIYVGTGEPWTRNSVSIGDGIYKSNDGGQNWVNLGLKKSERIATIIVDPNNSKTIYVAAMGALWADSEERGVYKSIDGGENWERVLYVNPSTGCADLVMDPKNTAILYASMWEHRRTGWSFNSGGKNSALYKSVDAGKTWNKIHNGFPEGNLGRLGIAVAKSNPNVLYTVIEAKENSKKGLYRSDDAGKSWKQLNNDFGITVRPFYFSRIVVDPKDENVIAKAGLSGSISRDGGKTFRNMGNMHGDIHDFGFNIDNSDVIYVATDGGFYRSWDGGSTLEISEDLPLSQFYHISVDNEEPYNVYGGLQDNGSWYGPSSSGGGINASDWVDVGVGDGFRVLSHPTKRIVYSEMQGAENVWRYDIDKKLVKTIQPLATETSGKLRFNWNAPMAVSDHQPDRIYMGSQFLHKSEDMGNTWEIISPDLTTNDPKKQLQENSGGLSMDNSGAENHTTIFTIAESPLDQNIIWVGTDDGNVQLTKDGGKTWTNTVSNIRGLPANTWSYHIEASSHNKASAYTVFDGHTSGDMKPYAYKTEDYGKTWRNIITDEVKGFARNIQEDFVNEDLLFLGTEFGLFISLDGGISWSEFSNNMPPVAVHFIDLQKKTNDLVMGTHGRGVIIIDDISPLRELNKEVLSSNLHFFNTKPYVMKDISGAFGNGFGGETQFVGQNPSSAAQIKYLLPKRHTFGTMTMEIQDLDGNKVLTLGPGKSKGINIVDWNYTIKSPKVAKGKTFSFGGFTAPRVTAGKYKAVITKGKETFEQIFEVENDSRTDLTPEDQKLKHEFVMNLYNMTQELAYMVYKVDLLIDASDTDKKLLSSLNNLKKSMVVTTGDNYVGSAEPQLRERLADLYSKVAGSYDKPSNAEIANFKSLEKRFNSTKEEFSKLIKKSKIDTKEVKSFNDFINE